MTPEEIVTQWRALSEANTQIQKKADELIHNNKKRMAQLDAAVLKYVLVGGTLTEKTAGGSMSRDVQYKFSCPDWSVFYGFVLNQGVDGLGFLHKRLTTKAVEEYLTEQGKAPPGIDYIKEDVVRYHAPEAGIKRKAAKLKKAATLPEVGVTTQGLSVQNHANEFIL